MKTRLLLILLLATFINVFAQKSAPVAGDAAQLIDLLKKDYNALEQETAYSEIIRDRAKVIRIFKSYLKNKDLNLSTGDTMKVTTTLFFDEMTFNDPKLDLTAYNKAKNDLEAYKKLSTFTQANYNSLRSSLSTHLKDYIENSFKKDQNELLALYNAYKKNDDKNIYIREAIKAYVVKYKNLFNNDSDGFSEQNYQSSIQKSLPFLGGNLAFETLIDGLSRFLANRIKEELTTYVIEHIQGRLNNPSPESYLNELMVLMPRTTDYLKSFEADQVLNFIDESKQYIEDDLNNLLDNSANLRYTPRFIGLMAQYPELEFAFEALELIPQLSKVKSPIDYFDIIESSKTISRWSSEDNTTTKGKIATGIRLASMLAHSLTILDNGELKFASIDFMSNYGSESNFYKLYIGFLHQQNIKYYDDLKFDISSTEKKYIFDLVMANTGEYEKKIKNILPLIIAPAERLHNDALAIKRAKDNSEKVTVEDIHSFINGIIAMSETIVDSAQEILDIAKDSSHISNSIKIKEPTVNYFKLARISNDVFLDIHNKKFSLAIIKALDIYPILVEGQNKKVPSIILTSKLLLQNQEFLKNLTSLLKWEEHPTKSTEKLKLKDLALNMNLNLERIKWDEVNIVHNEIYKKITAVTKNIEDDDKDNYKKSLNELKNELKNKEKEILKEFMSIDLDNLEILVPINEFIDENIIKHKIQFKDKVKEKSQAVISSYLKVAINNSTLNFEKLSDEDKEAYVDAKNDFNKTIQILLPQLLKNTLNLKDSKTIKLVHFLNDIALSESAEDIEKAISAFALPAGSFALKKKKGPFVSINSFPGILVGSEQRSFSNAKFTLGFTAPIGLYTKLNIGGKNRLGLFAPIIDIAAPVRFRFDGTNDTETLPEFNFKNILSPGLYFTHRIGQGPITLNIGGQFGPELQVISEEGTETFSDSFRVGVGLTLDIPLLVLYKKPVLD